MEDPLLEGLTEEQRRVVLAPPGPLLVLAGAGSGKTRVLVHRVAHLLRQGVPPGRVLLMTFTALAAREMVARCAALLRRSPALVEELWAGTFHHVALRLLRRHGACLGLRDGFVVLDRHDGGELLGACLEEERVRPAVRPAQLQRLLSLSVGRERPLADAVAAAAPALLPALPALRRALDDYARRKLRMGALDFDDLLLCLRLLLCDEPAAAARVRGAFEHLLVDEYQDTSPLEAALLDDLARDHGNVTAVGDDGQAIYGFRGGDVGGILGFPARWPGARVLALRDNHRSAPPLVALANASIAHNRLRHERDMRAVRAGGGRPALVPLPDDAAQAAFVAARIEDLLREGARPGEVAVLYRAHAHSAAIEAALTRRRLPYRLRSGTPLLEQAHVKDALAFLRLLDNPADEVARQRALRQLGPEAGAKLDRVLTALAAPPREPGPPEGPATAGALLLRVLALHYEAHARRSFADAEARLLGLRHLAMELTGPLRDTLAELALRGEEADGDAGAITLSTVHRAKGLEWPVVFVVGLAEGRFPAPGATGEAVEEERRLFYVAVTRARDELYLCCPGAPSRFVRELDGRDAPFERWRVVAR